MDKPCGFIRVSAEDISFIREVLTPNNEIPLSIFALERDLRIEERERTLGQIDGVDIVIVGLAVVRP